jgi:hypothetical protein
MSNTLRVATAGRGRPLRSSRRSSGRRATRAESHGRAGIRRHPGFPGSRGGAAAGGGRPRNQEHRRAGLEPPLSPPGRTGPMQGRLDVAQMVRGVLALLGQDLLDCLSPRLLPGGVPQTHSAPQATCPRGDEPGDVRAEGLQEVERRPDRSFRVPQPPHPIVVWHQPRPVERAPRTSERGDHDRRGDEVSLGEMMDELPDRAPLRSAPPVELPPGQSGRGLSEAPRNRRPGFERRRLLRRSGDTPLHLQLGRSSGR